ncbi:hypothetical protein [Paenibacillus tundrae]
MNYKKYIDRHWKYMFRPGLSLGSVSRKTKKAANKEIDEMGREYERSEWYVLDQLPDCPFCGGTKGGWEGGDPFFSGNFEGCEECEGTGKTGWKRDSDGKVIPLTKKPSNNAIRLKRRDGA